MTSTASGTSTSSYELIVGMFGAVGYGGYPFTVGTGYTQAMTDASSLIEGQNVSSTGSYTATATAANSVNWGAIVVGFKNAIQ